MPNEMREYENQEMEGNESPVPQEDEERSVEGIQKEQAPAMEEPAAPAVPAQTSAHRSRATQTAARRTSVVAIGAQLQAETEAEKNQNALLDLVESKMCIRDRYDAQVGAVKVLSHLDGDLARLLRFREGLWSREGTFEVVCFPQQGSFVREFLGDRAGVREIPIAAVEKELEV